MPVGASVGRAGRGDRPGRDKIILSAKVAGVQDLIAVYAELATRSDHALHLGLTEAGMGSKGIVASSAAMGILLQQGIGDTIRISLTPEPGGDRTREVQVAQELLQTMGFRQFVPVVAACPGCGRTTSTVFQELAQNIQDDIRKNMPVWREKYPGVEELKVAVMGCIVNGPGETKHADIGISLPGTGETPAAPVFIDGKKAVTLRGPKIAADFEKLVADYIEQRFGQGGKARRPSNRSNSRDSAPSRRTCAHVVSRCVRPSCCPPRPDVATPLARSGACGRQQRRAKRPDLIDRICNLIETHANRHNLPQDFFARLIWKESRFDPNAVSPVGAEGIAQFMPGTAAARGLQDSFDIEQAIPASAKYLAELKTGFGNLGLAAAAYNAGENRVSRWLDSGGFLPMETENYVLDIMGEPADKFYRRRLCRHRPAARPETRISATPAASCR